jgi:subtilisin family serine protease
MPRYRIKAYFMHEHEQAAAQAAVSQSAIEDAEWTDGYVMGVVDQRTLKSLEKQGLVVSLVEQIADAEPPPPPAAAADPALMAAPGVFAVNTPLAAAAVPRRGRPLPVTVEKRSPAKKILTHDPRRTQYYIVRFHGSITEERRKDLRKLRVKLLERLTRNKYTVQLKPSEVKVLAALPFVDSLRLYTEADTLSVESSGEAAEAPKAAARRGAKPAPAATPRRTRRTRVYLVRLHQAKDMSTVVKWLAVRRRKPIWKHRNQLQVALLEGGKVLNDLAKRPEVAVVEQAELPRLYDEPARTLLGLVRKNATVGLEGDGEIVGVADTGIDKSHADLTNRIAGVSAWGRPGDTSDPEGHGTHVAGCIVGDGTASQGEVLGAAPKAKLFFQSILDKNGGLGGLPSDIGELLKEAYAKGARVHNNSWGAFSFARYSSTSLDVDRFVAANPDMLVVIAAGNDGIGIARGVGSKMNADKGFVDWPCVAAPATAKNGLTVGASRSSRKQGGYAELTWSDAWPDYYPDAPIAGERISSDDQCLAAFSSRGPSDDQRIKPDVVAPGTDIAAAKSKDAPLHKFWGAYPKNKQYGFMGGTSMAAPYVSGCAALVREWYRKHGNWATPSAALLKATLINGTRRITGNDSIAAVTGEPNFHQGFGRIDMSTTVPNPLTPGLQLAFVDTWKDAKQPLTQTGKRVRFQVTAGNAFPLRLCLTWTDPPARGLQNSLLLLVDDANQKKWVGNANAATILNIAGGPRDPNNNVQVVRIDNPTPGIYTIVVVASNLLIPPQAFALVVAGDLQSGLTPLP